MTRLIPQLHNRPDPSFDRALSEYLTQFEYKVTVRLGSSYTQDFKEFTDWCNDRLGTKYKDWFLLSQAKGTYTLFCRDNKWAMFLALTHVDKLA